MLSEKGVSASPDKVKAVRDYPTPKSVKDVRSFLGLALFYRRLVQDFATIAKPLTELTKNDRPFLWGPSQQKAFDSMKDKLCTTPVLAYCDIPKTLASSPRLETEVVNYSLRYKVII